MATFAHGWFHDVTGGWPNLMQGLFSSLIGAGVAALVAWWVVNLTHKKDRQFAVETDALAAARTLVERSSQVVLGLPKLGPEDSDAWGVLEGCNRQLETWRAAIQAHRVAIQAADPEMERRFDKVLTDSGQVVDQLAEQLPDNAFPALPAMSALDSFRSAVREFSDRLEQWSVERAAATQRKRHWWSRK